MGAHDRDVACRVTKAVLLLVRSVVFLVDDDQPEARQRSEYRRTRAEHDRCLTGARHRPGARAFAIAQTGMQYGERDRKARTKTRHQLRGESNLRHQYQCRAAARQHPRDCLQIHFGFAASGYAMQQERLKAMRGGDGVEHRLLCGIERVSGR